jgi:hypothetical protein
VRRPNVLGFAVRLVLAAHVEDESMLVDRHDLVALVVFRPTLPILRAVNGCMRPVWVDKGLAHIEAYDAIDLVGLHDQLRGLGLADQFERVVHRRLTEILGPPIVPPAPKVVKLKGPSERQAKMEARRAEIETKLELGRRLLELRAKVRWGNEFGRQRRKLFDVDTLTACELMRVARVYGERPEIWQRLSWQALVQLSAPSLPAKHREQFERRTIAGEGIKGSEIARARCKRRIGRPKSARMAA